MVEEPVAGRGRESKQVIDLVNGPISESRPLPRQSKEEIARAKYYTHREKLEFARDRRQTLREELQRSEKLLQSLQAENDLLLDAMQIVVPSQPNLVQILHQMEVPSEPDDVLQSAPGIDYELPSGSYPPSETHDHHFPRSELESQSANGFRSRAHPDSEELRKS